MDEEPRSEADQLLDRLVDANVLAVASDDELELSETFAADLEEGDAFFRENADDARDALRSVSAGESMTLKALLTFGADCPELLAEYLTLAESTELTHDERLRVLPFLGTFRPDVPPETGVPEPCIAIDGERLPFVVSMFRTAIVYVWKEECPPCDLVRGDLEALFEHPPDDHGLFAVHGPSAAEFLYEEYRVDGAPTTLFFLDGEVDVRLRGAESSAVLEAEVEKLRKLAERPAE